jgi:hypothetical protein
MVPRKMRIPPDIALLQEPGGFVRFAATDI